MNDLVASNPGRKKKKIRSYRCLTNTWCSTDTNVGFTSGEFRLDAMAFAEDLLDLAFTRSLQARLDELAKFLEPRGVRVNVAKSFTPVLQSS